MTKNQFIEQATLAALRSGADASTATNRAMDAAYKLEQMNKFKFHIDTGGPNYRGPDAP